MESGESRWTEGIKNQASRLAALTEKLVILSKMEEGDIRLTMGNFSLSEAFFEQCEQYKSQAVSKNVRFDVNVSENIMCHGNAGEIGRFISLMLDNAFRYCNADGYVRVEVQKLPAFIEIKFENSTDGVEKGNLDIWFERFYRRDKSRNSDTGGSGIGLSVAKAIVKAHGGHIHAFSDDGKRVVFIAKIQYH
jgi:signal transduction histidine kinase